MIEQVLIAKRIFLVGESYARQSEPLSAGLAISFFQDSVEQLIWCIAKHNDLVVKDTEPFTALLDKVDKSTAERLPHKAKILELNKARVGFKHYGNLPANSEPEKFRAYAYDFMLVACQRYLAVDFERVSLASLISDSKVRTHIEAAEENLAVGQINDAVSEVALARFFLFQKLSQHFPKVDQRLRSVDRLLGNIPELQGAGIQVFHYLTQYFDEVARFNAASLAGGSVGEHLYFERELPRVTQFGAGNTKVSYTINNRPSAELAERAIKYVVETSIRSEAATR
ncbi:MAG: hypothetical protein JJT87_12545 [Halomonas sp.]|nr:hypothetical protein [Halomonas sp.]MCC5902739.1 hypothetical protein [Halomonas sp.]